jgi:hypothetical protein
MPHLTPHVSYRQAATRHARFSRIKSTESRNERFTESTLLGEKYV